MDDCQRPLESPITAPNDVNPSPNDVNPSASFSSSSRGERSRQERQSPRGSQEREHHPMGHRRGSKNRRKPEGASVLPVRRLKPQAAATCKSGWLEAPTPARIPSEEEETQLAVFAAPKHMYTVPQGQKLKIAMFSQRAVRHPNRILNLPPLGWP